MHFSESVSAVPCRMPRCQHQPWSHQSEAQQTCRNDAHTHTHVIGTSSQYQCSAYLPGKEGSGTEDVLMDDDDLEEG